MICLSLDSDHMTEARMQEFLQAIPIPGRATFFCTQLYACLEESRHETAPHPFLPEGKEWSGELRDKREMLPEAVGWRAHSCVFSHLLAEWLGRNGYRYASSDDRFGCAGIEPVRHAWGVWHMPIYYMDNMDFSAPRFWGDEVAAPFSRSLIDQALEQDGLYIFDFHPIHLLLNTPDPDFYFNARDRFLAGQPVEELTFDGYGTRSYFEELRGAMEGAGVASVAMVDALASYDATPAGS